MLTPVMCTDLTSMHLVCTKDVDQDSPIQTFCLVNLSEILRVAQSLLRKSGISSEKKNSNCNICNKYLKNKNDIQFYKLSLGRDYIKKIKCMYM